MIMRRILWTINIILISLIMLVIIFQPGVHTVVGESMEPTIYEGDRVLIIKSNYIIVEGDIIAFYWAEYGFNVIHRIYEIEGNIYRAWGDNNPEPDDVDIRKEDIIGKMILIW